MEGAAGAKEAGETRPVPETEGPGRLELVMVQRDPDEAGGGQGQLRQHRLPRTPHREPLCILFPPSFSLHFRGLRLRCSPAALSSRSQSRLPLESPQGQGLWLGFVRVKVWLEVGPSLLLPGGCRPVLDVLGAGSQPRVAGRPQEPQSPSSQVLIVGEPWAW